MEFSFEGNLHIYLCKKSVAPELYTCFLEIMRFSLCWAITEIIRISFYWFLGDILMGKYCRRIINII